jgi:hypothetical protein
MSLSGSGSLFTLDFHVLHGLFMAQKLTPVTTQKLGCIAIHIHRIGASRDPAFLQGTSPISTVGKPLSFQHGIRRTTLYTGTMDTMTYISQTTKGIAQMSRSTRHHCGCTHEIRSSDVSPNQSFTSHFCILSFSF